MTAAVATALSAFPDKRLARAASVHPKTAARWKRGEAQPTGDAVLRMMERDDEVFAALLAAAGRADHARKQKAAALLELAIQELGG